MKQDKKLIFAKPDWVSLKGDLFVALKLTLICFTAVLLLSIVNLLTCRKIEANNVKTENITNRYLMPDGVTFNKKLFDDSHVSSDSEYYFEVADGSGSILGWTVSVMANGYGGPMKIMAGFDTDYTVKNVKLLNNTETPGVGKNAERDGYMDKFMGTGTDSHPIPTKKSMLSRNDIDSVTGATITFNGISSGLLRASKLLKVQMTQSSAGLDETDDTQAADK